jgi:predicted cobalt transporter CbtA
MLAAHAKRGVKAGVVAGLAFGLFVALVANPLVAFADGLGGEDRHAAAEDHGHAAGDRSEGVTGEAHHGSAVSTAVTNGVSILSGVLWGVLLGGVVFGVAYYFLEPAIPGTGGTRSYLLAAAGFVTVSGAPWLVLPPQSPGVQQAAPAETRIVLYGGMMIVGALVCLLSGLGYDRLRDARGRAIAAALAVLPFGLLAIPAVLAPVTTVESTLPPELATGLTGTVVFGQALLWLLLAGTHARLRHRSTDGRSPGVTTSRGDTTVTAD